MAAIKGDGESESWLRQKANVARIFTEFQEQDTHLSVSWELLSASVLCDRPIYERFAHFLVHVYVIPKGVKNAGLSLGGQSVLNYLGSLINRAATRFLPAGTPDIKEFFFCLESKSGSASTKWLQKLKQKIIKLTFERAVKLGEQIDNSEGEPTRARCSPVLAVAPYFLTPVCLHSPPVPRAYPSDATLVRPRRFCQGCGAQIRHPHQPEGGGPLERVRVHDISWAEVGSPLPAYLPRVAPAKGEQAQAGRARSREPPAFLLVLSLCGLPRVAA